MVIPKKRLICLLAMGLAVIQMIFCVQNIPIDYLSTKDVAAEKMHHHVGQQQQQECHMLYLKEQKQLCKVQSVSWQDNCRPNYFIAGTRKGGTTSLHTYMAAHPNVFPFKIDGKPQDGESFQFFHEDA